MGVDMLQHLLEVEFVYPMAAYRDDTPFQSIR
jgi:hypothetical protein